MDEIIDSGIAALACITVFLALLLIPAAIYECVMQRRKRKWLRRLYGLQRARRQQAVGHAK